MSYTSPKIEGMNQSNAPRGWIYENSVAVSEQYVLSFIAGIFFQTIFQIDTSFPLSIDNDK